MAREATKKAAQKTAMRLRVLLAVCVVAIVFAVANLFSTDAMQPFFHSFHFMFRGSFPLFGHKVGVTDQQLSTFLHEKGVMADETKVVRDAEFKSLLKADPNTDYAAARARLERIMSTTGDEHSDALPASVQSLTSFMQARPIWRKHLHPAVAQYPVQRVQRSGLCYILAPEVVLGSAFRSDLNLSSRTTFVLSAMTPFSWRNVNNCWSMTPTLWTNNGNDRRSMKGKE